MKSICVYCGSSDKVNSIYLNSAREMGALIARKGLQLIYGAGNTGLMGALATGALEQGGEIVGVIPKIFDTPQLAHQRLTRIEVVADMHTRKARIAELADGFIAMPGGFGTLEEFFEILTWAQIGLHSKPIGLLNVGGYYGPLMTFMKKLETEGFLYAGHNSLYVHNANSEKLLENMHQYQPPDDLNRWVERE